MKSKLIIIEGCDGSGKTTLIKDLKEDIKKINPKIKIQNIAFPYNKAFGYLKIRSILADKKVMHYPPDLFQGLYVINMIDCFEKVVNPFFKENPEDGIIFIDRSIISTLLYNAINGGSIYNSIRTFLKKKRLAGDISISEDDSMLDLDMILNKYCHLEKEVDHYYFLQPPINVLLERSKERTNGEEYDSQAYVQRMHRAYNDFYQFVSAQITRNIMDFIEGPDSMVRPNLNIRGKITQLNSWNDTLPDEDNHTIYRNIILKDLGL